MKKFNGIEIRGAREHNLKDVSLKVPRNKLTVLTGLSGSGKSTVAFDIIYAEGQRRYIESLSAYARHFMEQLKKPEVESISGLSPSVAIDQKTVSTNPRSTVGTVTEIYDYLRLLFARVGTAYCPEHQIPVSSQNPQRIVEDIMSMKKGTKFIISAPMAQAQKGEFLKDFKSWIKKGFVRVKIDGVWTELVDAKRQAKHKKHDIDLLVDRLVVDEKHSSRLKESVNLALSLSDGLVKIEKLNGEEQIFSIHRACSECGFSFPEMEPRLFSFNNPKGACSTCKGLGYLEDEEFEADSASETGEESGSYWEKEICPECEGTRLCEEARHVFIDEKSIFEFSKMPASELFSHLKKVKFNKRDQAISKKVVEQITSRLEYMMNVGTGYLSLDRQSKTLSGGEGQRIRLATQVGSALIGVLYVLDEPSIGLHPRDHHRLLDVIKEVRDRGNTVLLVEHDEDTMNAADHIIDLGPGAGVKGGEVVGEGSVEQIKKNKNSITGAYLSHKKKITVPKIRKKGSGKKIILKGARGNNLQSVDLEIPLGTLCGVTGVSGSGKSTLIIDTFYRAMANKINKSDWPTAEFDQIKGADQVDKVIEINQKPIGRTPRSTPATYVGVLPLVRSLYSKLAESQIRGYKPGHFSFNVKGGRCEECQGAGVKRVEMHFLSDVFVECDSCFGKRYNSEVLSIRYKEKNIAEILEMTVAEAAVFFKNHTQIYKKLETLNRVGMDYMHLGQNSTTLSGGEAQRVKLSRELSKRSTGKTLYILDEPTTGLHFADVHKLTELLLELSEQGNTVIVIEHNMEVIKVCDYVIDLGPDGGIFGGEIVAQGAPEEISKVKKSITGKYLKPFLEL